MIPSESITQFIESAKSRGASDETIVGLLKSRGWSEKDAYAALGAHYQKLTGLEIPARKGSSTAAKDAFFYLLIFSTLATWTFALGSLAFSLIEKWMPDAVFQYQWQVVGTDSWMASELAALLVSFPIYLLISRIVIRDTREHPDKLISPVRKWLTYLALVIAAGIFIGDLITILTYLLKGELTSRFIAKASVVLILSGGVFFYYYGGMKKSDETDHGETWNRERWMAVLSTVVVTAMIVIGFMNIGPPKRQRFLRADARRMQDVFQLSGAVNAVWQGPEHKLPSSLDVVRMVQVKDPETQKPYGYVIRDPQRFSICTDFRLDSGQFGTAAQGTKWAHSAGHHCFEFEAGKPSEPPPYYGYY